MMASYNRISHEALAARSKDAVALLESCEICPRHCRVNRLAGEKGFCRGGRLAKVYSYSPHFGEEPPLVGRHGSGTIFLSGCNLECLFCQNYEISQMDQGQEVSARTLAKIMMRLQDMGCHNINLVTPSHFVPQIIEALAEAAGAGLKIPLVYNSGGYDRAETIHLLDGIFDIYMPDAKYGSDDMALRYSNAPRYTHYMKSSIKEMHRQVGDLVIDKEGIAARGLLVRHLVLPDGAASTKAVVRFLALEISRNTYLNVMAQYRPEYNACSAPRLNRCITQEEYASAVRLALDAGLCRGLAIY
jgi:putative pyruvate formate lyase activating enzyme